MDEGPDPGRVTQRVARTAAGVEILRKQLSSWLGTRRADDRFSRFHHHFDVLDVVLTRMLDAVDAGLRRAAANSSAAVVYEECRDLDRSLLHVQGTFQWYARKYDQRLDDRWSAALRAADEVVRSCWSEPFAAARRTPPTGPLPYFDARFDAFATPRVSPPPDLRAPADAVIAEHVRELPIPTIALPEIAEREPWWLVLAAHETGHHVQKDLLPTLESATSSALAAATGELGDTWSGWSLEVFADAYSVLMVGSTAAWAVDELQYARPANLVTRPEPGDRYPPPVIRLALLGELSRCAGVDRPGAPPLAADVLAWLRTLETSAVSPGARRAVERHLAVVPMVAAALLGLPIGGSTLRALSGLRPDWFGPRGQVRAWARQLRTSSPLLSPVRLRPAARLAVAAGIAVVREAGPGSAAADGAEDLEHLRGNLLRVLPSCGEPGVLAASPPAPDVAALADRLAARLLQPPGRGEGS